MVICWSNKKEKKVIMLFEFNEIYAIKAMCDFYILNASVDKSIDFINSYNSFCNCLEVVPYDKER